MRLIVLLNVVDDDDVGMLPANQPDRPEGPLNWIIRSAIDFPVLAPHARVAILKPVVVGSDRGQRFFLKLIE